MTTGNLSGCNNCGATCDVCGDGWAKEPPMSRERFRQEAVLRCIQADDTPQSCASSEAWIDLMLAYAEQITAAVFGREEGAMDPAQEHSRQEQLDRIEDKLDYLIHKSYRHQGNRRGEDPPYPEPRIGFEAFEEMVARTDLQFQEEVGA